MDGPVVPPERAEPLYAVTMDGTFTAARIKDRVEDPLQCGLPPRLPHRPGSPSRDGPEVVALSTDLLESFADRGRLVDKYRELADAVRHGAPRDEDAVAAARQYNEAAIGLADERSGLDRSLVDFLNGTASVADVRTSLSGLETALATERDARDTLNDLKAGTGVPALLYLDAKERTVLPNGTEADEPVELSNLGGEAAVEVSLSVAGDLPLEPSVGSTDRLGVDDSLTFDLRGSLPDAGGFEVATSARADRTSASRRLTILVVDKAGYLTNARTELRRIDTVLEGHLDEDGEGAHGGGGRSAAEDQSSSLRTVAAKLTATLNQVETALHVLDRSRNPRAVDSHIGTALRKLDEYLDHLGDVGPDAVSPGDRTELHSNALDAKRNLEEARRAAI